MCNVFKRDSTYCRNTNTKATFFINSIHLSGPDPAVVARNANNLLQMIKRVHDALLKISTH